MCRVRVLPVVVAVSLVVFKGLSYDQNIQVAEGCAAKNRRATCSPAERKNLITYMLTLYRLSDPGVLHALTYHVFGPFQPHSPSKDKRGDALDWTKIRTVAAGIVFQHHHLLSLTEKG